jgi:hypothetical protein
MYITFDFRIIVGLSSNKGVMKKIETIIRTAIITKRRCYCEKINSSTYHLPFCFVGDGYHR